MSLSQSKGRDPNEPTVEKLKVELDELKTKTDNIKADVDNEQGEVKTKLDQIIANQQDTHLKLDTITQDVKVIKDKSTLS